MPERKPLSKKKELQPHGGYPGLPIDDNPPDISAANYYYKHRILPRRVKDDEKVSINTKAVRGGGRDPLSVSSCINFDFVVVSLAWRPRLTVM